MGECGWLGFGGEGVMRMGRCGKVKGMGKERNERVASGWKEKGVIYENEKARKGNKEGDEKRRYERSRVKDWRMRIRENKGREDEGQINEQIN